MNDAISAELSWVNYSSFDDAVAFIRRLGAGCLLAKLDLMEAYRAVPVHPVDQPLLAVRWGDAICINLALSFGLWSAPKIFSATTVGMLWILHSCGVEFTLHYLDDFLLLGPADSLICSQALATLMFATTWASLWRQIKRRIAFLSIEIDTVANQLRLPRNKLDRLHREI